MVSTPSNSSESNGIYVEHPNVLKYNNCSHEGTNCGINSYTSIVLPGYSVWQMQGSVRTFQQKYNVGNLPKKLQGNSSPQKFGRLVNAFDHSTIVQALLIESQWSLSMNYAVWRAPDRPSSWEVAFTSCNSKKSVQPIPIFRPVRSLYMWEDDGTFIHL